MLMQVVLSEAYRKRFLTITKSVNGFSFDFVIKIAEKQNRISNYD